MLNLYPLNHQAHLKQAFHSRDFVESCIESFPDHFFDWKITGCFYSALHFIRGYLETQKIDTSGFRHKDVEETIDFNTNFHRHRKRVYFPKTIFLYFKKLRTSCDNARYECYYLNEEDEKDMANESLNKCQEALDAIVKYLESKGFPPPTELKTAEMVGV